MKIIAIFAFCNADKELVKGVKENLSWVDDFVIHDDTKRTEPFNEYKIRHSMKERAIKKGADWILELDPDERFEKNAEIIFRAVTYNKAKVRYRVNFRELYTPDSYRVDGSWKLKHRISLYPVYPDQKMKNKHFNVKTWPVGKDYKTIALDVNLYHLKHIEPENRAERVRWLKQQDPNNKTQKKGYNYLLNENHIELEKIPKGREYIPKYERWEYHAD